MTVYTNAPPSSSRADCPINPGADFDPAENPIIARHWFGIEPLHLHRLGPRALTELLAEIAAEHGITTGIEREVARYAAMAPKALDGLGGGRFPTVPIHEVSGT